MIISYFINKKYFFVTFNEFKRCSICKALFSIKNIKGDKIKMKKITKIKKKWVLLIMALVLVVGSSISAYAVSCKNPTVVSKGKTKECWACGKKVEYVQINLHKGHKIKELKVDGKDILYHQCDCQLRSNYSNGKCKICDSKITTYDLLLKKGTHKIEVKDDKGYWVTTYVTIDKKSCKHLSDGELGDLAVNGGWHWCIN